MKTASPDGSFIDYIILRFGVRVRRDSCRSIVSTESGWQEYGPEVDLPVSSLTCDACYGDLVANVREYQQLAGVYYHEDCWELRDLLSGTISLQTALERMTNSRV